MGKNRSVQYLKVSVFLRIPQLFVLLQRQIFSTNQKNNEESIKDCAV